MNLPEKIKLFNFCPACGARDINYDGIKQFTCTKCSFTYFHNIATACAAILQLEGKILLIRRKREPGKGKLDLPGGFIDPGESAEEGLKREIKEELNIEAGELKYLCSYANEYEYKDVLYNTCDIVFTAKIDSLPTDVNKTEIEELLVLNPTEIPLEEIAFKSIRKALELFLKITY